MERWRVSSRGNTSLFKPYLYVPLQRVGFCAILVDLESGMGFEEPTGAYLSF